MVVISRYLEKEHEKLFEFHKNNYFYLKISVSLL